jgi:hypothetical protein
MNPLGIDTEIISRWKNLKDPDEKSSFYFSEIRPSVTSGLRKEILKGITEGTLEKYERLILVAGNDANPSLIIAGALQPEKIIAVYTEKNRAQLEERFLPELKKQNPRCNVELMEIDYCNHDENYRLLLRTFKVFSKKGSTLCDITGGKKITSGHLALISRKLSFDICYLDATGYIQNSAIPEPGNESLYIHKNNDDGLYEFTVRDERVLFINSVNKSSGILYNLGYKGVFFKFNRLKLSASILKTLRENLESEYRRIDHNIRLSLPCGNNIREISATVRSMLIDPSLDRMLLEAGHGKIRLVIDPDLTGIPWDAVFAEAYGAEIPVQIKINRNALHPAPQGSGKNGILVLFGSGEGVPDFDLIKKQTLAWLDKGGLKYRAAECKDRGKVQSEISRRRYNIILYFGHSDFDRKPEKSGWRCLNGELFPCTDFNVMRNVPPDIIISNSCHSARSVSFASNSIAGHAVEAGAASFIGTRWFLESGRSFEFLSGIINRLSQDGDFYDPWGCFLEGFNSLKRKYGADDISVYNYVYFS